MIAELRHRVLICSQKDVVVDGEMSVNREGVNQAWAAIKAKKSSTFSPDGATMKDNRSTRTHIIAIRHRTDLNISSMAWVYEQRLKSSPRWFKILSVSETEDGGTALYKMDARLVERGDDIAEPTEADETAQGPMVGVPEGVKL